MYLESYVSVIDGEEDNEIAVYVGQQRKPPCIIITFQRGKKVAILQGLSFFSHCNINSDKRFLQRSGAVELMLKVTLQWLVSEYDITRVTFSDKSHSTQGYMLPEKMILTEGKTWYQKHFDAKPDSELTKMSLKAYLRLYNDNKAHFISLPNDAWVMPAIKETLKEFQDTLKKQQLSGTVWQITRKVIESYNIPYTLHQETLGGSRKANIEMNFTPSIWW